MTALKSALQAAAAKYSPLSSQTSSSSPASSKKQQQQQQLRRVVTVPPAVGSRYKGIAGELEQQQQVQGIPRDGTQGRDRSTLHVQRHGERGGGSAGGDTC